VLIAPLRRRLMMALVTGALFMEILDGTILTTALPAMARTFHTSAVALDIGISAYLLALGVLIPASGWLADRFGARSVFAAAIAIFTIASALCGQAQSVPEFVALRVLQGVGGAMMTPVGRLVVMRHTPRDQLIATLSALIWPALFAPVVGPPIGGLITEHLGWRWIFWFNVPIGAVALAAALWLSIRAANPSPAAWLPDAHRTAGIRTVKVLPTPGVLSTVMVPPWACTMCLTIERPRPVPPSLRLRALSTR
jgi:MFS family permease